MESNDDEDMKDPIGAFRPYTEEEWARIRDAIIAREAAEGWIGYVKRFVVKYHPRILFGVITLFFGVMAYVFIQEKLVIWRISQQQQQIRQTAESAFAKGDPEPLLSLLRSEVADLKRRREYIEKNLTYEVVTYRRSGREKRTVSRMNELLEVHSQILQNEKRIAEIEPGFTGMRD
jgi:hypothetical protein